MKNKKSRYKDSIGREQEYSRNAKVGYDSLLSSPSELIETKPTVRELLSK